MLYVKDCPIQSDKKVNYMNIIQNCLMSLIIVAVIQTNTEQMKSCKENMFTIILRKWLKICIKLPSRFCGLFTYDGQNAEISSARKKLSKIS